MVDSKVIKSIVLIIEAMDYGDTITHSELASNLGVAYRSSEYRSAISKLQRECLEKGKMLENVIKVGYRVSYPDDYSSRALRHYKRGARQISKGEKV